MKPFLHRMLAVLLLGMASNASFACTPPPPKELGFKMFFEEATTDPSLRMFLGRVVEVRGWTPIRGHLSDQRARIQVLETFSGVPDKSVWVGIYVPDPQSSPCPFGALAMKPGQIWFVVGRKEGEVVWPYGIVATELLPDGVLPFDTREELNSRR